MLWLLVRARDRDTVAGDLHEEYLLEVLPARGPIRARLWYWRQVASFVSPVMLGLAFGAVLGVANLIDTAYEPLSDDSAGAMLTYIAILVGVWTVAALAAGRRRQSFRDAIVAGVLVGGATLAMCNLANYIRVNLFLDAIRDREDWRNLMARYRESHVQSLRVFVNYDYLKATVAVTSLGAAAGCVSGVVGGAINALMTWASSPSR